MKDVLRVTELRLRSEGDKVSGLVAEGRIELHAPRGEEHLWSPQLIIDVEPYEDRVTLRGRFGPHPSVWTMFLAGYAALSFLGFVGAMVGVAELVMGKVAWSFLAVPGALLLSVGLYALALLGQRLGEPQMLALRGFLQETLDRLPASSSLRSSPDAASGVVALPGARRDREAG